jgi:hypothetical protein
VHRWEAGEKEDRYIGNLEARAGEFFIGIMKEAQENSQKKFVIYLDNLDVICGMKHSDELSYIRLLAG